MKKILISLEILIVVLLLSSCTSNKNIIYVRKTMNDTINIDYSKYRYRIQPRDLLNIRILSDNNEITKNFNVNTLSSNITYSESNLYIDGFSVSDSGYVYLPIIGKVNVIGSTIDEIHEKILNEAVKYLNNPTIVVKLAYFKISVIGEVKSPGLFKIYNEDMNIFQALALAGDINDNGNKKNVLLIRNIDNKAITYRLDLASKSILYSDYYHLMPNDIIYIEPVKAKALRIINAPSIQIMLQTITTTILVLSFIITKL